MSSNTNQTSSFQRVIEGMYDFLITNNLVTVLPVIQDSNVVTDRQQNRASSSITEIIKYIEDKNLDTLLNRQQIEENTKNALKSLYAIAKELSESQDSLQKDTLDRYREMMDSEEYRNIIKFSNSANTALDSFATANGIKYLPNNTNVEQVDKISLFSKIKNDKKEFNGLLKSLQDLKNKYNESDSVQKQKKAVAEVLEEILLNNDPEKIESLRDKLETVKKQNPQWSDGNITQKLLAKHDQIVGFINGAVKEYNNICAEYNKLADKRDFWSKFDNLRTIVRNACVTNLQLQGQEPKSEKEQLIDRISSYLKDNSNISTAKRKVMEALIKCLENITEESMKELADAKTHNPGWDKGVLSVRAYSAAQKARSIIEAGRDPKISDDEIDNTKTTLIKNGP